LRRDILIRFIEKRVERKIEQIQGDHASARQQYGYTSGIVGIFLNFVLFALKLVLGIITGSVAVMADAFNNLTDSAGSIGTILGFKISAKPADKEHPFGHGRFEDVIAVIIAISIVFVGIEFARNSISAIINPEPLSFSWISIILLIVGFFVKLWMWAFNKKLGKKIDSATLLAVATDSRNDCIINVFIISSILAAHFFGIDIDGWAGLVVSLILLYSGYQATRDAVSGIIGKPVDKATAQTIKDIAMAQEGVVGAHDLVVHRYGHTKSVATLHLEMDENLTLRECHIIADAVETSVFEQLGMTLTTHKDPVDKNCPELAVLSATVREHLEGHCPKADAHEFRLSKQNGILNFVFEMQLPHGFEEKAREVLIDSIKGEIAKVNPDLNAIISVEYGVVEEDWF